MSLVAGQLLDGKYRIVRVLGQGAMGAVFEGENTRIRRRVAIKVLHAAIASHTELVQRFEREAQAAGRIGSMHIVEVLDLGELPDGTRYLVMEFLDGESLRSRIPKKTRVAPAVVLPLLRQLLLGLGAAHQAGIVHRDLKPDNVFLVRELAGVRDFVKIVDFGVSKFDSIDGQSGEMTRTGIVVGTPYYMSPEQARGAREVDARSDLFSVGVILYEAVTGRVPFEGDTFNDLLFKIALTDAPAPESLVPDLDPNVGRIVRRALARDPGQRFQSAADFVHAIDEWLGGGGTSVTAPAPADVALQPPPEATVELEGSDLSLASSRGSVGEASTTQLGATLPAQPMASPLAPTVVAGPIDLGSRPAPLGARRFVWMAGAVVVILLASLVAAGLREVPQGTVTSTPAPAPTHVPSVERPAAAASVSATPTSAPASVDATPAMSSSGTPASSVVPGAQPATPASKPPPPAGDPVAGGRRLRTF